MVPGEQSCTGKDHYEIMDLAGEGMYEVILAVKSDSILEEINKLHIWGESTGFHVKAVTDDFEHLVSELEQKKYDLILLENLPDNHMLSLLQKIKKRNLCCAVAVVCSYVDFQTVRKSFLSGADDFFVTPFERSQFVSLFGRMKDEDQGKQETEFCAEGELLACFEHRDGSLKKRLEEMAGNFPEKGDDQDKEAVHIEEILDNVIGELFKKYEWLSLYFAMDDYLPHKDTTGEAEERIRRNLEDFQSLYEDFTELYPHHSEGLEEVFQHILKNPEGDLRQKTISEDLYINRSYLSTVFSAQTDTNFVEYVNTVKMKRAAWLLKHTKRKIVDIAGILDYKDMGYFLKRFKARYGVTPSQYRLPETYEFQI